MCNDYAREIEMARVIKLVEEMKNLPPFEWREGLIPNNAGPTPHIKIGDKGLIARLENARIVGETTTWAWKGPQGKPVFNFVSEKRDFSKSDRCLILATGFYEYTAPAAPKVKLKDQHLFTMRGQEWFWVAGIVKEGCFAMLTTAPGPDMKPYHDRQICVLRPATGVDWLRDPMAVPLKAPPLDTLKVKTLRRDGITL